MIRPKNPPKILSDVFPEWFSGTGIFQALQNPPWASLNIDPDTLDIEYFGNISGDKLAAPLVHKLLTDDGVLDSTGIATLASIIKNRFYQKWTKLFSTYYITYDPLRNYNITESGEENILGSDSKETTSSSSNTETHDRTDEVIHDTQDQITHNTQDQVTHNTQDQLTLNTQEQDTKNLTDTLTLNTTEATTSQNTEQLSQTVNSSRSDTRYGFNSVDAVPTEGSSGTETTTGTDTNNGTDSTLRTGTETTGKSGTDTVAKTGTETSNKTGTDTDVKTGTETTDRTGTDTTTYTGTVRDVGTGAGTESGEHEQTKEYSHTRTGLNGLRTVQEIIEQDRALWMVDYFAIVYADVNTVLTNPVYPSRRGLNYPWVNWGFSNN